MRIFVTGSNGFIGSHFVKHALANGHEVVALRRSVNSKHKIAFDSEPTWLNKQFHEVTPEDFDDVDVVVHLAAHSIDFPYDSLLECLEHNLIEPLKMLNIARLSGIVNYVIAGTCFEYGKSADRYSSIPVNANLEPTNPYAASKAAASISFCQWASEFNLSLSYHRIFNVYGDGEPENRLWSSLRRAALSGADFDMTLGEQIRDFVPVEYVADELLTYSINPVDKGKPKITNIGTGKPLKLREFAEYWWSMFNATGTLNIGALPYRHCEVMRYVPEII